MSHTLRLRFRRSIVALSLAGLPLAVAPTLQVPITLPAATAAEGQGQGNCQGLEDGTVDWGVKQSFRHYITGPIANGGWDLDGIEYNGDPGEQGAFRFHAEPKAAVIQGDSADIPLRGSVHFNGHFGILSATMKDLELRIRGNHGELVGTFGRPGLTGELSSMFNQGSDEEQTLAVIELDTTLPQATDANGHATLSGSATLTEASNQAMGGNYGEGNNEADPFTITLDTNDSGQCGDLAATNPGAATPVPAKPEESKPGTPANTAPAPANTPLGITPGGSKDNGECTQASSASVGWGVKQSFRRYLTSPIANGDWQLNGVGFSGDAAGAGSTFDFTADPQNMKVTDSGATLPLSGEITFSGHFGLLKIQLSNMSVKVDGTQAQFIADFESNTVSSFTPGATVTGRETGTQATIATFQLEQPLDSQALATGGVTISGPGTITSEGNRAFGGNYGEGNNEADPIHISVDTPCGQAQPATPGQGGAPANNHGQPGQTQPGVVNLNNPGAKPQGNQSASGQQPAASPKLGAATTAEPGTCDASSTLAVSDARMAWGVKDSFRTYLRGNIAKGGWTLDNVTESGGSFVFSGNEGAVDTAGNRGSVKYSGAVTFYGHGDVLRTTIANPEITFNGASGILTAQVQSNDTDGNQQNYGRIPLADLSMRASVDGSVLDGSASASLTQQGAAALGNFYEPGTALNPITFKAALNGTGDCDAVAGSNTNTARINAAEGPKMIKDKEAKGKDKLGKDDLASFAPSESAAPEDGKNGSKTNLLDGENVEPTSLSMAVAKNPGTPVGIALLVLGAGWLLVSSLRRRKPAVATAKASDATQEFVPEEETN